MNRPRLLGVLAIVALTVIPVISQTTPPSQPPPPTPAPERYAPQSQTGAQGANPGPETKGERSTINVQIPDARPKASPNQEAHDQQPDSAIKWSNIVIAIFTGVLAVVGGLQWIAINRQSHRMHEQLIAMKENVETSRLANQLAGAAFDNAVSNTKAMTLAERAYVTMSHHPPGIDISSHVLSGTDYPVPIQKVRIAAKIQNFGNTPARVTAVLLQFYIGDFLPQTPLYDTSDANGYFERTGVLLVRNDAFTIRRTWDVPSADIEMIQGSLYTVPNAKRLWIFGYVEYVDQFNVRHRAGYARVYDRSRDEMGMYTKADPNPRIPSAFAHMARMHDVEAFDQRNNLPFVTQPGYNYDRERQQGEGNDWDEPAQ